MNEVLIQTPSKSYSVHIEAGIRHRIGSILKSASSYSRILIVADENAARYYEKDCVNALISHGFAVSVYTVPAGDQSKSMKQYEDVLTFALAEGLDRKSCIVALGGGMVGDLAGFVAASYMRGIGFVQVPTTLLAHDSSVGGKVAINLGKAKNMVGAFYQPDAVFYDTETLQTLPMDQWRSGFAEMLKHGIIGNVALLERLLKDCPTLEAVKQSSQFAELLATAIQVKADIVAADETEAGVRAHLNFGHTLAHSLESLSQFQLSHGDAVAIGMRFALKLSRRFTGVTEDESNWRQWFDQYGFPRMPQHFDPDALLALMKKDKKASYGTLHMVLLDALGVVSVRTMEDEAVLEELRSFQKEEQR
ncbi:3-dehydroquinate synthase [Aureibacillus halotolerans]|uniref:3-dehydroquinate synthase n=1 Tax=Aureibacillus halotolerans TaxID=1508390 RepID=A0A4R6U9L9_9BACI|nr:3-dehydroquinate synthase [Aureibacillus halotolerans]TDQ41529.1 3-dehydroquinate synthase [Aureibacillus halotolerans]